MCLIFSHLEYQERLMYLQRGLVNSPMIMDPVTLVWHLFSPQHD